MKTLRLSVFAVTALLLAAALYAAELTKFTALPGSKVKIDGTSSLHDWTVEGGIIAGVMELDSAFTADPTKAKPGKLDAKVEATIPVRTIKSSKTSSAGNCSSGCGGGSRSGGMSSMRSRSVYVSWSLAADMGRLPMPRGSGHCAKGATCGTYGAAAVGARLRVR